MEFIILTRFQFRCLEEVVARSVKVWIKHMFPVKIFSLKQNCLRKMWIIIAE